MVSLSNHGEGGKVKKISQSNPIGGDVGYLFLITKSPKVSNNLQSGNTTYIVVVSLIVVVNVPIVEIDVPCIAHTLGVRTRTPIIIN